MRTKWIVGAGVLVVVAVVLTLVLTPSRPAPEMPDEIPIYQPERMPEVEEEAFFVDSGGVKLEARLLMPVGGRPSKPAVVFSPGSSLAHFDDYSPGFLESYVEGVFLPNDIAVLYVNKRGVGQSEGNARKIDLQGRADDLYAAVLALQHHPALDAERIGVLGHSQGGWVSSLVASQHPDVAFFITLAGPTTTVEAQIEQSARSAFACEGAVGAALERKVARQMLQTRLSSAVGRVIPVGEIGFIAGILDYDPRPALQAATPPGLLIFGANDGVVPPAENLARLDEIFPQGAPETLGVVTIPQANHLFRVTETGCEPWPAYLALPYSQELVDTLTTWLQMQGFGAPRTVTPQHDPAGTPRGHVRADSERADRYQRGRLIAFPPS